MALKSRQRNSHSHMPEVNLIPMMDVLMTILVFFILIAMTLTAQQRSVDVALPTADTGSTEVKIPDPLIVGLNQQNQVSIGDKQVTDQELAAQVAAYLSSNPKGGVILKADRKLPYEDVIKVLGKMRDVGGDRVSLALDQG